MKNREKRQTDKKEGKLEREKEREREIERERDTEEVREKERRNFGMGEDSQADIQAARDNVGIERGQK